MIRAKKTAQLRLSTSPIIRRLAEWERPPIGRPIVHKRYAKKRRMERKHVRSYIPKRPILETLVPSIEYNYVIKAIDKWEGEKRNAGIAERKCHKTPEHVTIVENVKFVRGEKR